MQPNSITEHDVSQTSVKAAKPIKTPLPRMTLNTSIAITTILTLVAIIPRIVLATQLDLVTDEVVYIPVGQVYWTLLRHANMLSNDWRINYEHPPFVKLLIGLSIWINTLLKHPLTQLLAGRIPSIISGTLLIVAMYWLGRKPFGHVIALLAALCIAVSPWVVYFSALAYLDTTMMALMTVAYLLLWYAIRRPWLYLVVALLVALGVDSKYTAALAIPGMFIFTLYYFLAVRPRLPAEQRPAVPWLWWIAAIVLAPLLFLAADPAIWPDPYHLLHDSFLFEWDHSKNGHLTFLAGQYSMHVPHWAILYILMTKISAFVTIAAALFIIFAVIQLLRFHLRAPKVAATEAASISFLFIWLIAILGMFSLLNIVVGTHYHLPMAPPVAFAGACGLATLLRYRRGSLFRAKTATPVGEQPPIGFPQRVIRNSGLNPRVAITVALLGLALVGPHLYGLVTVHAAEGYTSEFFQGEDSALQVAYPGYRDAVLWLNQHTHGIVHVGLGALPGTINGDNTFPTPSVQGVSDVSWYNYNSDLPKRIQLSESHYGDKSFPYDYLVWPMHLVQRGYAIPAPWNSHIVHIVMGGETIYCYITAKSATAIKDTMTD